MSGTSNQRNLKIALIGAAVTVIVAAINIVPSFFGKEDNPSKVPSTHAAPAIASPSIVVTGSGSNQAVVNGNNNTVIQQDNPAIKQIVEKGLPQDDHPIIDLSKPIEQQIQLFPEDKVTVVGWSDRIEAIWLGQKWERVIPNSEHAFTVWGVSGEPVIPKFRGSGQVKLEVSYTRNRDKPRDLREQSLAPLAPEEQKPVEKK